MVNRNLHQTNRAAASSLASRVQPQAGAVIELGGYPIPPAAIYDTTDTVYQSGGIAKIGNVHLMRESGITSKTRETLSDVRATVCSGSGGGSRLPEHHIWIDIKQRCYNSRNARYADYGGRGIAVCQSWLDSFDAFLRDLGPRPSPRFTLERIDNNGPYSPENCCWATYRDQARNRRSNVFLAHNGITLCLSDWATRVGINRMTLTQRLQRGWSVSEALSLPARRKQRYLKEVAPC